MPHAILKACLVTAAAAGFGGCSAVTTPPAPPASAYAVPPASAYESVPAGVTPSGFQLPSYPGCPGDIARFHAVVDNDLASGHTTDRVHSQIMGRLATLNTLCTQGKTAEVRAQLSATKRAFGYPDR
jgi:hypothetical protein